MLRNTEIRILLNLLGQRVVVPSTDEFPYAVVAARAYGYSPDPERAAIQAKLSVMLEANIAAGDES